MDLRELRQLIQDGVGMAMSTRDQNLWPDLCEVMGLELSENSRHLTAYISQGLARDALANIQDNGWVAISMSRPCSFKAAQIKGRVRNSRPMTAEDFEKSRAWAEAYRQEIQLIGVTNETASGLKFIPDTALEIEIQDIYVQTPGHQAGKKMEAQ